MGIYRTVVLATSATALGLAAISSEALAVTLTATARGSQTPQTVTFPNTLTNGDFLITANGGVVPVVGDGVDENTTWTFDFTTDPNFAAFSTADTLTSAFLTLELIPRNSLITTDEVSIQGFPSITQTIQSLPVGQTATVELELLDFYSSSDILGTFVNSDLGQIPMLYADDAVVSFAELQLSNNLPKTSVPEPAMLLGLSIFGVNFLLKRAKSEG